MSEADPDPERLQGPERDAYFRRLERRWQEEVGRDLLDVPHAAAGAAEVYARQFACVIDAIDLSRPGFAVEIGCGKGHFLEQQPAGDPVNIVP